MSFSNTYETTVLTWTFTADTATRPTAWYLGLYTSAGGEGAPGTEVTGGSYVRETVAFTITGNTASNTAAVEWPTATASWGTVSDIAVLDAITGGNVIAYATLDAAKTISTGDVFRVPAGDLDITLD
jgi:hypothetical protein